LPKSNDILRRRLQGHRLTRSELREPSEIVGWLGAVQAQDYPAAKWALGLRAPSLTDSDVETAFTEGRILRTHVLRPTWHFVTPADIRWMLDLTGPGIRKRRLLYERRLGLDAAVLKRSRAAIARALRDGAQLTRAEIGSVLRRAGVKAETQALAHVMMNAELEGVVCSGARRGKQFTYSLLAERAPRAKTLARDEALGELARRYFTSHGPATLRDYVWWSGLNAGDARRGLEIAGRGLERETIDGRSYWSAPSAKNAPGHADGAHLLPNYDEYVVAYRDREAGSDVFGHSVIVDGRMAGNWTRTASRESISVNVVSCRRLTPVDRRAVWAAAGRYGRFMKQAVICGYGSAR
jgi:winged helix DNA-binding protein